MYLIQLLVPLFDNNKQKFPVEYFNAIRDELAERFGGVTAFFRSPAVGLWKEAMKTCTGTRSSCLRLWLQNSTKSGGGNTGLDCSKNFTKKKC